MDALEIAAQRENTIAFIAADPTILDLTHNTKVRTASGGYRETATTVPSQIFRLIPQAVPESERETPEGSLSLRRFVLLGRHDADVRRGDTFVLNDERFQVTSPPHYNAYEVKAEVTSRGR